MKANWAWFVVFASVIISSCGSQETATPHYMNQEFPGSTPVVFAPGVISTKQHLHSSIVISNNAKEWFFSTANQDENHIIYQTNFKNGEWTTPEIASFSGEYSDDRPFYSPDNQRLYFESKRPHNLGGYKEGDFSIWFAKREGDQWGEAICDPVFTNMKIDTPILAANGNLYFSNKSSGEGSYDIFVSEFSDGKYNKPVNLGKEINTPLMEGYIYIAPKEEFIIFGRFGGENEIGLNISNRNTDGSWAKSQWLGEVINSNGDERFPRMSPDQKLLFFNRQTEGRQGDVYWVDAGIIEQFMTK